MRNVLCLAVVALGLSMAAGARAQNPADLTALDKTEVFIQHLIKVARIDPSRYRALVLEYEIGRALRELAAVENPSEEDHAHAASEGDYIQSALKEIYPRYAEALRLTQDGKLAEAREAVKSLAAVSPAAVSLAAVSLAAEGQGSNPYLAAYAHLLLAELDHLEGSKPEEVIERCESIARGERLYLIPDYRACELIALSYEKLKKPLLEFVEYAILLTDYLDVPPAVASRVEARLAALADACGRPLSKVASWMNQVEKLLKEEITARDPTQRQEAEVVSALDKLIELEEARERKTCSNCGGAGCRGACRGGRAGGNRSNSPAQVSSLPQAKGEFLLHGVSDGDRASVWGQLKERDASRVLQSFRGKLPPHYEKLLEQYYKNLSKLE